MRRQSMQEYQGISILFFSRQSKTRDQHLVFLKSKQSKCGQDKLDSKIVDKSVDQERKISARQRFSRSKKQVQRSVPWVSRVEGLTLREAPRYRFKISLKERLAALDASDHVLQAAACGVDNKTEDSRILRGVHVPCQRVRSMGAPDHGPQLQRVVKKGAQDQHRCCTEAMMRRRGQRRSRPSFNLRGLSESRQVTLEKPVFATGNLAKLLGGA